jgi:type II secretion system protein G
LASRHYRQVKPPLAIQLACAAQAGVDLFLTNDEHLARVKVKAIAEIKSLAGWYESIRGLGFQSLEKWVKAPPVKKMMPNMIRNRHSPFPVPHFPFACSAFTLIELMTVIAIIAVLAGLILGIAGYAVRKADISRAIANMEKIKGALEEYRLDTGGYFPQGTPTQMNITINTIYTNLLTYRRDLDFIDPWGNYFFYRTTGKFQYQVWSLGPDNNDPSDDIRDWSR